MSNFLNGSHWYFDTSHIGNEDEHDTKVRNMLDIADSVISQLEKDYKDVESKYIEMVEEMEYDHQKPFLVNDEIADFRRVCLEAIYETMSDDEFDMTEQELYETYYSYLEDWVTNPDLIGCERIDKPSQLGKLKDLEAKVEKDVGDKPLEKDLQK